MLQTRMFLLVLVAICTQSIKAQARERRGDRESYVEVAPLKGVYGQLSARAEMRLFPNVAVAAFGDSLTSEGELSGYDDKEKSLGIEALLYPFESEAGKIFVGAGFKFQQTFTGRSRLRNTRTWARTLSDESHDLWVDQGEYWCATQTIGYRIHTATWFTSSLRLVADQVLRKNLTTIDETLGDASDPANPNGRRSSGVQFILHAGLIVP